MRQSVSTFRNLVPEDHYDIADGPTGYWITRGIQGCAAMAEHWPRGAEAWPAVGEEEVSGGAVEVAE